MVFIIKEINKIIFEKKIKNLGIFIDMDGVIADYRFGEGNNIIENKPGVYINKRPIKTIIDILDKVIHDGKFTLNIISSCLFKEQEEEKKKWISINLPFIDIKNVNIVISKNFELRKEKKIEKILEIMRKNKNDYALLIDDTHEILFLAQKESNGKIIPIHIVTLLD